MNHSLLFHGPIPDADVMSIIARKYGLGNVETNWTPKQKFPRMDTAVFVAELPASFKHDKRAVRIEDAQVGFVR